MASLDDVLGGDVGNADTAAGAVDAGTTDHTGETQTQTQPAGEGQVADGAAGDPPPGSEHDKVVPLKALEEERKGRQDWKEKAVRFEEQLKAAQAQIEQSQRGQPSQQQQEHQPLSPEMALLNERMNMSEMIAREKYPDLDDKFEVFKKAAAENPALGAELVKQRHPYDWMYKQAAKLQALADIGDDPTAYEQKMREKIMAELAAQQQPAETQTQQPAPTNAALNLPKSLATARSSAPRSAAAWTGPTSLNDVVRRG